LAFEKFDEKQAGTSARVFYCLSFSRLFISAGKASLEHAASEAQFFETFFDSLDLFFLFFFFIKEKERKSAVHF
jgi:hypothetical protein